MHSSGIAQGLSQHCLIPSQCHQPLWSGFDLKHRWCPFLRFGADPFPPSSLLYYCKGIKLTNLCSPFLPQFAAELEQLDQLLPSLEKAAQLPGLCGPERSESGVAVKPEMLAAPLQPSTAPRAPAGLNRRCQPWDLTPCGVLGGWEHREYKGDSGSLQIEQFDPWKWRFGSIAVTFKQCVGTECTQV